jgi:hypothetical protein
MGVVLTAANVASRMYANTNHWHNLKASGGGVEGTAHSGLYGMAVWPCGEWMCWWSARSMRFHPSRAIRAVFVQTIVLRNVWRALKH